MFIYLEESSHWVHVRIGRWAFGQLDADRKIEHNASFYFKV